MNLNPMLSVARDGTVLYSNEASESLLQKWGAGIGEKLPSSIVDIVQNVISRNNPEKIEVKMGNKLYLVVFSPLPEEQRVSISGFDIGDQKKFEKGMVSEARKEAELETLLEELRKSEEKYHTLFETIDEGFCVIEVLFDEADCPIDYRFLEINAAFERQTGIKNAVGRRMREIAPKHEEYWFQIYGNVALTGEPVRFENLALALGYYYDVYAFRIGDPEQRRVGILFNDITERKRAEEALRESEKKYRRIVETAQEGIWLIDQNDRTVFVNQKMSDMLGFSINEILGQSPQKFMAPEFRIKAEDRLIEHMQGTKHVIDYRFIRKDGSDLWCILSSGQLLDNQGKYSGSLAMITDITKRKRAEELLRKREEQNEFLLKLSDSIRPLSNAVEIQATVTRKTMDFFGADRCYYCEFEDNNAIIRRDASRGDLPSVVGIYLLSSLPIFKAVTEAGSPIIVSDVYTTNLVDEELRQLCIQMKIISYINVPVIKDGKPVGNLCVTQCTSRNWTDFEVELAIEVAERTWAAVERARVEEALRESELKYRTLSYTLEEKVKKRTVELEKAYKSLKEIDIVRKQEIHHRIKNNLQVISSLLDLQAEKFRGSKNIEDSEVLEAFRESQNRVISMALIHEELYKGKEIDTLNFSKYIEELADNLFLTYRFESDSIILDMDIEENIFFDMDMSIPLGIIVNELVSNSLKHAFTGREKGEIKIKLYREENRECIESLSEDCKSTNFTLTISDDGVGIPEELDIEDLDSLGFQLVISLVDQLDGEFELKRNNGTEFTMRFKVTERDDLTQADLKSQECTD